MTEPASDRPPDVPPDPHMEHGMRKAEPYDPPSALPTPHSALPRPRRFTGDQISFIVTQVVFLLSIPLMMLMVLPSYALRLFTTSDGLLLTLEAVGLMMANAAVYLGLSLWMNRKFPPENEQHRVLRKTLSILLGGFCLLVFFLRALGLLLMGPASISLPHP